MAPRNPQSPTPYSLFPAPYSVAYLVNQYPTVSHTFIRREIEALERRGVEVKRIAIRGWNGALPDPADAAERKATRYVLRDGPLALAAAVLRLTVTRPLRLLSALRLAWHLSRGAERPFAVHLVYLAEAARIVPWLKAAGTRHLHAHFGTNSATVALLAHALGGPPWSFTVHGPEEFDKAPLIALAEKARRAAFVAAISSYGRSQLYRLMRPADWPKVKVVPCGLAPESFAAPADPPPSFPAARRLVCVGRLCEQKGQLLLVEAARRLRDRGAAFELVLAGDGELRRPIEAALAAAALTDRVRITGWIAGDAVRAELAAARALVLPSFAEGLPVAIMEAMALGRPVISTYVAGIPELVQHGTHGWLVPAGDPEALADAMQACLDAPVEVLARMGAAARERVAERHDVDAAAERLAGLFWGAAEGGAG
jgi:glycosyltransferase involved in cell wall biosynthesis